MAKVTITLKDTHNAVEAFVASIPPMNERGLTQAQLCAIKTLQHINASFQKASIKDRVKYLFKGKI